MFKKGKKKSKDNLTKSKSLEQSDQISTSSGAVNPITGTGRRQQVDGFDENGFVDLKAEPQSPTLLGPKQPCQYVGTFPVHAGLGLNGEKTLQTHRERTRFVKEKLSDYRNSKKGVSVQIVVSTDGIKVVTPDGKRVRMAHALQRISFATCDPDFRLFAYMTHEPSPTGVEIYCHVFSTTKLTQVRDLTSLVGKAFQRAFAAAKRPAGIDHAAKMNTRVFDPSRDPTQPAKGRKWAKLEARKNHEDSEHAQMAKARRVRAVAKENRQPPDVKAVPNDSVDDDRSSTDGSPVVRRKDISASVLNQASATLPETGRSQIPGTDSSTNTIQAASRTMYMEDEEKESRFRSFSSPDMHSRPLPPTPQSPTPPIPSSSATFGLSTISDAEESRPDISQASPIGAHPPSSKLRTFSDPNTARFENEVPPELPPKQHTIPSSPSDSSLKLRSLSLDQPPYSPSVSAHGEDEAREVKTPEPHKLPPVPSSPSDPSLKLRNLSLDQPPYSSSVFAHGEDEAREVKTPEQHKLPPVPSSPSDPSLKLRSLSLDQPPHSPSVTAHGEDKAQEVEMPEPHKVTVPEQNTVRSHKDESWYLADISREFVTEMLENSEEGSFFVRDSQSRPGCFALTMRVPYEINDSGFGNYLITQDGGVFAIQGYTRTFPDLPTLIEYHARVCDGLPYRLLLSGSNVLCEDEEYMNMSSTDPDYMALSDYRDIYSELTGQ